jgi:hypothetical protein
MLTTAMLGTVSLPMTTLKTPPERISFPGNQVYPKAKTFPVLEAYHQNMHYLHLADPTSGNRK